MGADPAIEIRDQPSERRYEALLGGELAGWIDYRPRNGWLILVHTEVPPEFGGRGVGARLVAGALDDLQARGLKVAPECPFVVAYIRAHPAYQDLVVGTRGSAVPRRVRDPRDPGTRRTSR
jgi:uncharacterized protein